MRNKSFAVNILELNLALLFISTSGVLGRYIDISVPLLIALRAILAGGLLWGYCKWRKISFRIKKEDRKIVIIGGILMGLHWITYFYALKLSNIAIGMLSLFTYPAITAILEPLILKTKILKFHLFLSLVVLVGIYFLVPDFNFQDDNFKAVGFGVLSAFLYALRNIIMKSKINSYNGSVLMVYQMLIIGVLLLPSFFIFDTSQIFQYLPATVLLALLTTAIGHTLFLASLKHFSTITASIISCIQPVYGILTGIVFLQEYPKMTTVIGGAIIVLTVIAESVRIYRLKEVKQPKINL